MPSGAKQSFVLGHGTGYSGVQTKYKVKAPSRADLIQSSMATAAYSGAFARERNLYSARSMKPRDIADRAKARVNESKRWQEEMKRHAGNEQWAAVRARVAARKQQLKAKREHEIFMARKKAYLSRK